MAGLTQVNTVTPVGSVSRAWFVDGWNERGKQGICLSSSGILFWTYSHGRRGSKNIKRTCPNIQVMFKPLLLSHLLMFNWSK